MKIFSLLLIVLGVVIFMYGILIVLGIVKTDIKQNAEMDKKLLPLSDKTRYSIGRYLGGTQGIIGGLGLILLGVIFFLNA
jgi:hypothetical protein